MKKIKNCVLQPATACNQYSVFKELYDLSQDRLSAETRLSVLQQQRTQLDKVSARPGTRTSVMMGRKIESKIGHSADLKSCRIKSEIGQRADLKSCRIKSEIGQHANLKSYKTKSKTGHGANLKSYNTKSEIGHSTDLEAYNTKSEIGHSMSICLHELDQGRS